MPLVKRPHQAKFFVKGGQRARRMLLAVGIFSLLVGVVAGVGEFALLPWIQARRLADCVYPALTAFGGSLAEVNTLVRELFTLVSGEEPPSPQWSFNLPQGLEEQRERVAGERAKSGFYDFLSQARKDMYLISTSFAGQDDFGGRAMVAGAQVGQLESGATADLRLLMEKARACEAAADVSRDKFDLFATALPSHLPTPLASVEDDLGTLAEEGESYLTEAQRAARYYQVITDVQIGLVPATVSLVDLVQDLYLASNPVIYLGALDTLAATVDNLAQQVEGLSGFLPTGMAWLHEDNREVFSLYRWLLGEAKLAVSSLDFAHFDKAVTQFERELETLATRAKTYELSFWQETPLLKGYGRLLVRFGRTKARLEEFR